MPADGPSRMRHRCSSVTTPLSSFRMSLACGTRVPARLAMSPLVGRPCLGQFSDAFRGGWFTNLESFLAAVLFPRHLTPQRMPEVISHIQTFRDYFHYHIKASKAYIHSRMRKRTADFLQGMSTLQTMVIIFRSTNMCDLSQCCAELARTAKRRSARRRVAGLLLSEHEVFLRPYGRKETKVLCSSRLTMHHDEVAVQ